MTAQLLSPIEKIHQIIAGQGRRNRGDRLVTKSWLDNELSVHRAVLKAQNSTSPGYQSAPTIARSEFILDGLEQLELREHEHDGSWTIYKLKVK